MKIAVIGHHVAPIGPRFAGGVESLTWYLTRWLALRGHEVVLWAPPGSEVPGVDVRALELDPQLSDAGRNDVSMPPAAFMGAHHAYQRLLVELSTGAEPFDLVHSHSLHYLPVAMAALVPAPVLLTLHTPPTPWLECALRARTSPELWTSAVSEETAAMWAGVLAVDDVVPNGVDLDVFGVGAGGRDAVWCGRMVPEKAPHLAIDAARAAGLSLRLAGPVVDEGYWDDEVAGRLGEDAQYLGHLPHCELSQLVGHSRVALMTPAWEEPFGLAAAEAMATGTPVAAFARGGLRRIVGPAGGRLAAPGDVPALTRALGEAASLPRAGVRAHARASLGIDAMGRGYERLYARVLAEDRSGVTLRAA